MGLCKYERLLGCPCGPTGPIGKLKMKGELLDGEDLGPRVADGLAASTEHDVASTCDSNCSS